MADLYQAEVIAAYSTATIAAACNIAAVTLVFYDYALTFDQEVRNIWRIRFSSSALLFYVARYAALFTSIWIVLNGTVWSGQNNLGCAILIHIEMVLCALMFFAAAAFSALRAYAVCNKNRWALLATLTLALVYPAISLYTFTQSSSSVGVVPFQSCSSSSTISDKRYVQLTLVARACTVASDLLVLGLTLLNTWSLRAHGSTLGIKKTFSHTLMKSGTLSFVVISVVNIIGLVLGNNEKLIEPMSTWTAAFTAIMTYRFLLNLHEVARSTVGNVTTQGGYSATFLVGHHDTLVFRVNGGQENVSRVADDSDIGGIYGDASAAKGESETMEDEWDEQVARPSSDLQPVEAC